MDTSSELSSDQLTPPGLARLWSRRLTLADDPDLEDLFPAAQEDDTPPGKGGHCSSPFCTPLHDTSDSEQSDYEQQLSECVVPAKLHLSGASLGDFPAEYEIPAVARHEFPVVGIYVDPRIVPGFRYRVKPIEEMGHLCLKPRRFFNGRALTLHGVGRGYARRLTFEADKLNDNNNYFWADSHQLGFAFELEVISASDKFTLHDANHLPAGSVEVLHNQVPQEEVSHTVLKDGSIEKRVRVKTLCKVEWFENGQTAVIVPVSGLAIAVKPKSGSQSASVTKVVNVSVGTHPRRGFTLTPGVSDKWRRTTVSGLAIGDIPTRYTVVGLDSHELPVIGTYVDRRIIPGFYYRVRPAGTKRLLFDGRASLLLSIGAGYGKRLTFAPEQGRLNFNTNYLWSDSYPDGFGFEPRAVHAGMKFSISAAGQGMGEACVLRADAAQQEEDMELVKREDGTAVVKYIHVDVTCHVNLATASDGSLPEPHVMRVSGTAVVSREPGQSHAKLQCIDNIGLDSQLNLLFFTQQAHLVFHPL